MPNPFTLKVISNNAFFCNRIKEQTALVSFAGRKTNVVLYSPRRYGKTSLIRQVQDRLVKEQEALVSLYESVDMPNILSCFVVGRPRSPMRSAHGSYTAFFGLPP